MNVAAHQDPFILRCDGALTLANAVHWREQLQSALELNGKVLVDVGAASDIDITFVQILVAAKKTADELEKRIGVCPASVKFEGAEVAEKDFPPREAVPVQVVQPADDIDRVAIETLINEIGMSAVQQSLDVFFGEMTARLSALESYAGETQNAAVARETHLLKGTAGTFGLKQFAAEVKAFERDAGGFGADAYSAALDRMAETMRRSQGALKLMVGTGG